MSTKFCIFTRFKHNPIILMTEDRTSGLILTRKRQDGYTYLNIGRELSAALQNENTDSPSFSVKAYDTLRQILDQTVKQDHYGHNYIALDNLSILFEPALKINLRAIVEDYSRRYIFILNIAHPVEDGMTYYPFPEDKTYKLDLIGISRTTIG